MAMFGRFVISVACLAAAGAGGAATLRPARLPFNPGVLATGPEAVYHPNRWLTVRRSIAFASPGNFHEEPSAAAPVAALRRADALTGDVHPFHDALRVSLGFRADRNHRLLRMSDDAADIGTARYRPMMAVGVAGEAAPGLSIAADVGMLGHSFAYSQTAELITPLDQARRSSGNGYRPFAKLSAGYRF